MCLITQRGKLIIQNLNNDLLLNRIIVKVATGRVLLAGIFLWFFIGNVKPEGSPGFW